MKRHRSTKIVATLGPVSQSRSVIEELFLRGVDVFRLNFSHGTWDDHTKNVENIRAISKKYQYPIGIMQDLQGPKLRVGCFEGNSVILKDKARFVFDLDDMPGNTQRVSLPHPEIFQVLKPDMHLLLDDGRLKVRVDHVKENSISTTVITGGTLSNHKGVNVPDVCLPISALTPKDREDLTLGQKLHVDYVALSFVQTADDIQALRALLHYPCKILAKLEKPSALEHLESIIEAADGIMVARGDLGVEMSLEEVPILQRRIIRACQRAAKPVIVATQMLDSMIERATPTRAEASDVASAVYDAVDAVMLSAESASGQYPLEAVTMMDRIIKTVESDPFYRECLDKNRHHPHTHPAHAIAAATHQVAHTIKAKVIVTLTEKGDTTQWASHERPFVPIMALTPNDLTAQQLTLVWGVHAHVVERFCEKEPMDAFIHHLLQHHAYACKGDYIVMTSGTPLHTKTSMFKTGTTRALRIITLGEGHGQ